MNITDFNPARRIAELEAEATKDAALIERQMHRINAGQAVADALAMVLQHGRIDNSESRMNQVCAALKAWKEIDNG